MFAQLALRNLGISGTVLRKGKLEEAFVTFVNALKDLGKTFLGLMAFVL